jgi:uncharacterized protein (DUF433 family)
MSAVPQSFEQRFEEVLVRLERLEKAHDEHRSVSQWSYLVERPHPWRRQLSIKGRNMTAAQLVGAMNANELNEEDAAGDFELPIEAVREAIRYCQECAPLLALEANEQRRRLFERGYRLGPAAVSG